MLGAALAGLIVAAIHLATADPVAWWRSVLDHFVLDRFDERARTTQAAIHERRLRVTLSEEQREALRALGYAE